MLHSIRWHFGACSTGTQASEAQMTATVESEARRKVAAVQERLIADAAVEVRPRFVELAGGPRLQVLEAGDGEPLILLHGSGTSAVVLLPLVEHLHGRGVLVVDRPGYGLSDPMEGLRERPRRTAVDVVGSARCTRHRPRRDRRQLHRCLLVALDLPRPARTRATDGPGGGHAAAAGVPARRCPCGS